jgi:hypothetical protein
MMMTFNKQVEIWKSLAKNWNYNLVQIPPLFLQKNNIMTIPYLSDNLIQYVFDNFYDNRTLFRQIVDARIVTDYILKDALSKSIEFTMDRYNLTQTSILEYLDCVYIKFSICELYDILYDHTNIDLSVINSSILGTL